MATLGQTITVVNKSGKVVSTVSLNILLFFRPQLTHAQSKHLVNVFKEAKSAYREKKAEIQASRDSNLEKKRPKHAPVAPSQPSSPRDSPPSPLSPLSPLSPVSRVDSTTSSRRGSKHHHGNEHRREHDDDRREKRRHERRSSGSVRESHHRQPLERGYTDSFYTNDRPRQRSYAAPNSPLRFMEEAERETEGKELVRRRSLSDVQSSTSRRSSRRSSRTPKSPNSDIDMNLAYGELPPPLPVRSLEEQGELKVKVTALQRMLEEANCLHHSATATIKSLENNPDAMAAVAMTMAEISGIVSKMGPGALMGLKGAFPAVIALLTAPEFLIAAGVGVGITVIALGGYKIIKRIKAKKQGAKGDADVGTDELEELESDVDLDHIENWRRGIADAEVQSVGTSVDGEFITPAAAKELREQGVLGPSKKPKSTKESKKKRSATEKEAKRAQEKHEKQVKRDRKEREDKDRKERKKEKEREKKDTDKKESGLALMLRGRKEETPSDQLI